MFDIKIINIDLAFKGHVKLLIRKVLKERRIGITFFKIVLNFFTIWHFCKYDEIIMKDKIFDKFRGK